jgi:hypothetical protein
VRSSRKKKKNATDECICDTFRVRGHWTKLCKKIAQKNKTPVIYIGITLSTRDDNKVGDRGDFAGPKHQRRVIGGQK